MHPGSPPGGVSTFVADSVPARATTCTPAARRGESQPRTRIRRDATALRCTRQPAGVSLNCVHPKVVGLDMSVHPGSPPGWISTSSTRTPKSQPVIVHPAARRGGVSTTDARVGGGKRGAPGSPPG